MEQYRSFNERFRPLNLRVVELHLTERRTWFIHFDNGETGIFPFKNK